VPVMDDLELRELFASEVTERASRLVDAAQLAHSGTATDTDIEMLRREAHTIKGTARMMGFTAIGDAGFTAEQAVAQVDSPGVAIAIEQLGGTLAEAVGADPQTGTAALTDAVAGLVAALDGDLPPDDTRDTGEDDVVEDDAVGTFPQAAPAIPDGSTPDSDSKDLGGLLAALDSWAFGETVRVNAANLFKLINAICSLRVDTEVIETLVLAATADEGRDPDPDLMSRLRAEVVRTGRDAGDLQVRAIELASAPVSEVTNTFPQLLRYLARKIGKEIRFELVGDDLMADRQVLERIADPLRQLLVNAVHHGLEPTAERLAAGKSRTGRVSLHLSIKDNKLELVVEDDGRGVDWPAVHRKGIEQGLVPHDAPADPDRLRTLLFTDGFGTVGASDLVTGDGSGLAAVTEAIEALHGTFTFETTPGEGTRVVLVVPVSRALQDVILINVAGEQWGIPEIAVLDRLRVADIPFAGTAPHLTFDWEGNRIPAYSFADAAGLTSTEEPRDLLVVSIPSGPVGFLVDRMLGARQMAARELGPLLDGVPHLTGAALLGGGNVVVLVDPTRLAERASAAADGDEPRYRVLVVDDSPGARQVVGGALGSAGFEVTLAGTAAEALAHLDGESVDGIVLDYVMPDIDGASLVREIRSRGVAVPIVVLSGLATPRDQALALEAGANLYFDKDDVRRGALAGALRDLIGSAALRD